MEEIRHRSSAIRYDVDRVIDVTYEPVTRRRTRTGEHEVIGLDYNRQRRTRTTEPQPPRYTRRNVLHKGSLLALGGATALTLAGILGGYISAQASANTEHFQEGDTSATPLEGVWGHADSMEHPSLIHAYVQENSVFVVELPGGDASKAKINQLRYVPTGDVYVNLQAIEVTPKHFQLLVSAKCGRDQWPFQRATRVNWLLADSGKGYFTSGGTL